MTDYQNRVIQSLKNLIYQADNFNLDLLQKFIGKKIGDKFYKLKNLFEIVSYEQEMEDWTMDIITNMLAGFFVNWKTEYPNPDTIDEELLFNKFKGKVETQVNRIYEDYVNMRQAGFCDAYQISEDREDYE